MDRTDRRQFLRAALAAGAGTALGADARAIDPIRRVGKSQIKLSLAAYSYRRYLELKPKAKPAMTLDDFIDTAAGLPLDAVELTAYYFTQTGSRYLADLKGHCTRLGLDVSGCATRNDFCVADAEALKKQIADVRQ